jgi:multiple sugar transport system permease protein
MVTMRFALIALPVGLILPLGLAIMLNSKSLRAKGIFRTLFYFPYIVPFVAAIFVWGALLNAETGWINQFLRSIGVADPPNWLNSVVWVYPALVILGLWGIGNSMLIFLASLQGVPTELYNAAEIDGAGWWGSMLNVTLPMISPVIFYNVTLAIVGLFQYFTVPLVLNQGTGAPGGATMFYNLYLYKIFFTYQNMAYGATMAWLLFVIILLVTMVLFRTSKYWVYYAAESR